jgi:PEP-CTERM motif
MKLYLRSTVAVVALALASPSLAVTVVSGVSAPTSLGSFAAGTYSIAATGVVGLAGPPGNGAFDVGPNGVPVVPVTSPGYAYCNPAGCDFDIFSAAYGPGGAGRNLGALLGTRFASPTGPADFFLIGNGTTITLASAGNLYAVVNDTFYSNNVGSFEVSVSAVPEPATWAMMIGGFGIAGLAMRRRRRMTVSYG